jgi:hypothetical protein
MSLNIKLIGDSNIAGLVSSMKLYEDNAPGLVIDAQ